MSKAPTPIDRAPVAVDPAAPGDPAAAAPSPAAAPVAGDAAAKPNKPEIRGGARNGTRLKTKLADFQGEMGVVRHGDLMQIGYRSNRGGEAMKVGTVVTIEGEQRRVTKASRSEYAPDITIIDLELVE